MIDRLPLGPRRVRPDAPSFARPRRPDRAFAAIAAVALLAGLVGAGASRRADIRDALGLGRPDRSPTEVEQREIIRAARRPAARPVLRYPRLVLDLLGVAEAEGREPAGDFEAFRRDWDARAGGVCELTLVMQDWEHRDPISGHVTRRGEPGAGAVVDPVTRDRLTRVAITPATWPYIRAIDEVRRRSRGTGRGVDRLSGYRFVPDDRVAAPAPDRLTADCPAAPPPL